jgi:uncharacterized cupredoxin-like copper-binding protein
MLVPPLALILALSHASAPLPVAPPAPPAPPAPHAVTVVATDFHFALPATLEAGPTSFTIVNHGREAHHLQLERLEGGHTLADLLAAFKKGGPPPAWAVDAGGPNAADPGARSLPTTVDLLPGTYAAICVIPGPDGAPHVMKGMAQQFTVSGPLAQPASLAVTRDTITLTDYAFEMPRDLGAGTRAVTVRNTGTQSHELVITRPAPGRTAADGAQWAARMQGPPPAHFLGGVTAIAPGQTNVLSLSLTPGRYALLCFVPDAKDGRPHVAHGMMRDLEIAGEARTSARR